MKNWRSIIIGGGLLFVGHAHAWGTTNITLNPVDPLVPNITNFRQLVEAVESGNDVRAIIHFNRCVMKGSTTGLDRDNRNVIQFNRATTRFNFTQYFHAQEEIDDRFIDTVTTSMKIFLPNFSEEVLSLFGRLSIFEDNTAIVHVNVFDPIAQKSRVIGNWQCVISNGQDDGGVVLFNLS